MNKRILFSLIAILLLTVRCSDVENIPRGSDNTIPGIVKVNHIESIPGGAIISFEAPRDADLLYVKAVYKDDRDINKEVKVSAVTSTLEIIGFAKTGTYPVELYAVDRNENCSKAVKVEIMADVSPLELVAASLKARTTFGGVNVSFENTTKASISLNLIYLDEASNKLKYREAFNTSSLSGAYNFRGFESKETKFGVYVEDRWGHMSDTLFLDLTPMDESALDKALFSVENVKNDHAFNAYGFSPEQMWDNIWGSDQQFNIGVNNPAPFPHYFTLDLGVEAKLSRFKFYQRGGSELYKDGNPKHFEIYGALEVPQYNEWNKDDGWVLLKDCHSIKPSGLPLGQENEEDREYQNKGEEFELGSDQTIRYIRIKFLENYGGKEYSCLAELSFWGSIVKK